MTFEEIQREYDLSADDIRAALKFVADLAEQESFHPLPAEVVTIYPDWRGYEIFLVNDQIVVVNPRTLEIVAVLEA